MTDYLTLAEVVAIHADQIERYGGFRGIRDWDLLDSAVLRPQNGYYNGLLEEAAALWESLSQNHPFVDGNSVRRLQQPIRFWPLTDSRSRRTQRRHTAS
jgi:death-on-curing protein